MFEINSKAIPEGENDVFLQISCMKDSSYICLVIPSSYSILLMSRDVLAPFIPFISMTGPRQIALEIILILRNIPLPVSGFLAPLIFKGA